MRSKKSLSPSELLTVAGSIFLFVFVLWTTGLQSSVSWLGPSEVHDWREALSVLAVLGGLGALVFGSAWLLSTLLGPKQDITVYEEFERRLAQNAKSAPPKVNPTEGHTENITPKLPHHDLTE